MSKIIGEKKSKLTELCCMKLDNQKVSSDKPLIKKNVPTATVLDGSKGSGKTTTMLQIMKQHYNKYFDNIYLFSTTGGNNKKMKKLIKELEEDGKFHDTMSPDNFGKVLMDIEKFNDTYEAEPGRPRPLSLIILDDCITSFKREPLRTMLDHFIVRMRNGYRCSIIITCQKLKGYISMCVRSNLDYFITYRINEKNELKSVLDAYSIPEDFYKRATKEPYSFLTVNYMNGSKPIFYRWFNKFIIKESDDDSDAE